MTRSLPHGIFIRLLAVTLWIGWSGGCVDPLPGQGGTGNVLDGNRDPSVTSLSGKTSGDPNGSFADAIVAVFDVNRTARLQGTVSRDGDLDVFLFENLQAGDRLEIDVRTFGSNLDASIAVFDTAQRLVYANDDRGGSADRFLDPVIDWVVRRSGERYYLVMTHSAFADSGQFTGTYEMDVRINSGFQIPPPQGQVIVLDFDGGNVDSPVLGSFSLEPFDAGRINAAYEGQTETVMDWIRTVFEQNFMRFNVTVLTTDDPPPPDGNLVTTIFFGGFNGQAFGLSEAVDLYNADFCDDAIIFAESFTPSVFSFFPTAVELGVAIGNVAAHEAGHLLGLNHTDEDRDLMDDRSSADVFVTDQEFMEAPLSSDIMPIGTQDGVLLLQETVGLFGEEEP